MLQDSTTKPPRARSIPLALFVCLTDDANRLISLADLATDRRERTEDFEDGIEAAPRLPMTYPTYVGVASILQDLALDVAASAEYRSALARSEADSRRLGAVQNAKRRARANENKRARETGRCPRCVNGYIPNMPIDGGVCYRCNGTGR